MAAVNPRRLLTLLTLALAGAAGWGLWLLWAAASPTCWTSWLTGLVSGASIAIVGFRARRLMPLPPHHYVDEATRDRLRDLKP